MGPEDGEVKNKQTKKAQCCDGSHTPKVPQLRTVTSERRKLFINIAVEKKPGCHTSKSGEIFSTGPTDCFQPVAAV